jgi:hypothetical protein
MIDERKKNDSKYSKGSLEYYKKMLDLINENLTSQDVIQEYPVHFDTCNYKTYIARFPDGYHVATCNNEPFYQIEAADWSDYFNQDDDPKEIGASFIDLDEELMKREGKHVVYCIQCAMMVGEAGKSEYFCDRCRKKLTINDVTKAW